MFSQLFSRRYQATHVDSDLVFSFLPWSWFSLSKVCIGGLGTDPSPSGQPEREAGCGSDSALAPPGALGGGGGRVTPEQVGNGVSVQRRAWALTLRSRDAWWEGACQQQGENGSHSDALRGGLLVRARLVDGWARDVGLHPSRYHGFGISVSSSSWSP